MPSTSKKQQQFFALVDKCQQEGDCASEKIKKVANSMSKSAVKAFARTKHDGLPERVNTETSTFMTFGQFLLIKESKNNSSCKCKCEGCKTDCKNCTCKNCKCEGCSCHK